MLIMNFITLENKGGFHVNKCKHPSIQTTLTTDNDDDDDDDDDCDGDNE